MVERVRIVHGQRWGERLLESLCQPPADISAWMQQHTRLVKQDAYSLAGLVRLDDSECFLKFYRYKSPLRKMMPVLGGRRAMRSFTALQAFANKGIAVPEALCCLRVPEGLLLLTAGIPNAVSLAQLWRQTPSPGEADQLMRAAGGLMATLHCRGFVHGDCKWSNLLWSSGHFYLVDLDAARTVTLRSPSARDVARFTLNAEEQGVDPGHYDQFLGSYVRSMGESREVVVRQVLPYLRTFRERHRARYGTCGSRLLGSCSARHLPQVTPGLQIDSHSLFPLLEMFALFAVTAGVGHSCHVLQFFQPAPVGFIAQAHQVICHLRVPQVLLGNTRQMLMPFSKAIAAGFAHSIHGVLRSCGGSCVPLVIAEAVLALQEWKL
jgi:3-deoxy-D-manno-octulosonic acid kinase